MSIPTRMKMGTYRALHQTSIASPNMTLRVNCVSLAAFLHNGHSGLLGSWLRMHYFSGRFAFND